MDFLLHNWIADMPGSQFIWVALVYCVVTIVGVKYWVNSSDPTREKPVPPIDAHADPYELAYLRGGEKEIAVTALFNLIQQEYLRAEETGEVSQANKEPIGLNPIEKVIYDQFSSPQAVNKILFSSQVQSQLKFSCSSYPQQLMRKGMLMHNNYQQIGWFQVFTGMALLELPMLYKLMVAFAKGKSNVGFLIGLLFIAPITLFFICKPQRLTSLGKRYLAQFKKELLDKKHQLADASAQSEAALMVAVLGAGILAGTSYGYFNNFFPRASDSSGSSCGSTSSCGSSCSSSSCGGGGCGGCGGD